MEQGGVTDFRGVMDEGERFGDHIRRRRERLQASIEGLAADAKINRDTWSDLELGKTRPHANTRKAVIEAIEAAEMQAFGVVGDAVPPRPTEGERQVVVRPLPGSDPADKFMEVEVQGRGGFRMVVRGPVNNPEALADMAERLMRRMSAPPNDDNSSPDDET